MPCQMIRADEWDRRLQTEREAGGAFAVPSSIPEGTKRDATEHHLDESERPPSDRTEDQLHVMLLHARQAHDELVRILSEIDAECGRGFLLPSVEPPAFGRGLSRPAAW